MSSAETPEEDPDQLPPSDEDVKKAFSNWLFWNGWLLALALTVIGYGEATGRIHFFR